MSLGEKQGLRKGDTHLPALSADCPIQASCPQSPPASSGNISLARVPSFLGCFSASL